MKSRIKFYRVILNVIFYIFYVLLVSIVFSFIFPTVLVLFGKAPFAPTDPIFDNIQVGIAVLILITSVMFRKYFYLPIKVKATNSKNTQTVKTEENKKDEKKSKKSELDIKIGKEIK